MNQFAWRFDRPPEDAAVRRFHGRLAAGALARKADRSFFPGARNRWVHSEAPLPLYVEADPVPVDAVLPWLRSRVSAGLDPGRGTAWQLSYARTFDRGAVLSLVAAHAIADGATLVYAVRRAAGDAAPLRVPSRTGFLRALLSDVVDGAGQLLIVAKWAVRNFRLLRPSGAPKQAEPVPQPDWTMPHVVVECDTDELTEAAERHGGSVNTLFTAALARIASAAKVALPVSTRKDPDDLRANSTKIAMAVLDSEALGKRDLGPLKDECKRAYVALAPPPIPLALI